MPEASSIVATLVVAMVAVLAHVASRRAFAEDEAKMLDKAFFAHFFGCFVIVLLYSTIYGGDVNGYYEYGVPVADALRADFSNIAPELWLAFRQQDNHLPFALLGAGSTGSMNAISIGLLFLLANSLGASALLVATLSYFSKLLIYRAISPDFDLPLRPWLLAGLMFTPSGLLWTTTVLKEPIAMVCIGPIVMAARFVIDGRKWFWTALIVIGPVYVLTLIKPYITMALFVGCAAWVFVDRVLVRRGLVMKPVYLGVGLGIMMAGFLVSSSISPSLSSDQLGQSMAQRRGAASNDEGGSNYSLEEPAEANAGASLTSQIGLLPLALVTALFRPFLFEARNAMQFLNAIEATAVLLLVVVILRRRGFRAQVFLRHTPLALCAVFVLSMATGTGLASANLGSLSRYRAPMMPFLSALLLVAYAQTERRKSGAIE